MEIPENELLCDAIGCKAPATLILSFFTLMDEKTKECTWMSVHFCKAHMLKASGIIDSLVQAQIGLLDLDGDPTTT